MGTNRIWSKDRKLADPKWMDPSFFANEGFHFQELLQFQGLSTFVSLNCNCATKLVNDFYRNLKLVDGDLVTEVKGTPIRITPSVWLVVTGLRHEGIKLTTSAYSNWEGYDRTTALKGMLKDPSVVPVGRYIIKAGKLNVEDRMLHSVLVRILIPMQSWHPYYKLLEQDVFMMWLMKQRVLINWPFYMSNHMMHAKESRELPYACLITKFLCHFQIGTRNEFDRVVNGVNRFGRGAMSYMRLKKVNGVWVSPEGHPAEAAGDAVQADRVDEAHDMDAEEETQHHPPAHTAADEAHSMDAEEERQHSLAPAAPDDARDIDAEETLHPSAPAALDEAHCMDAEETIQHPLAPAAPNEAHGMDADEETRHPLPPAAPDEAHSMDAEEEIQHHPLAHAAPDEAHCMDAEETIQHPLAPAAPNETHGMDAEEETRHPSAPAAPDAARGMDAEETTQHPLAPAASDDRFDLLIAQMQDLKKFIREGFDHLGSSMASLDARMKVLENRKRLDNLASFTVSLDARIKSLEDLVRGRH